VEAQGQTQEKVEECEPSVETSVSSPLCLTKDREWQKVRGLSNVRWLACRGCLGLGSCCFVRLWSGSGTFQSEPTRSGPLT
jgi:hypothetical protein